MQPNRNLIILYSHNYLQLLISVYAYKDSESKSTAEDNLTLFGQCPIEVKPQETIVRFVDSVIDSSRYYVLRLKVSKHTHLHTCIQVFITLHS
jgi:hypothetical protein